MAEQRCLAVSAREINEHHAMAQEKARQAVAHALECGRLLSEAKSRVGHGGWTQWLGDNFNGSGRTARDYMKLHDQKGSLPSDVSSVRQALKTISSPGSKRQRAANLPTAKVTVGGDGELSYEVELLCDNMQVNADFLINLLGQDYCNTLALELLEIREGRV